MYCKNTILSWCHMIKDLLFINVVFGNRCIVVVVGWCRSSVDVLVFAPSETLCFISGSINQYTFE